MHALLASPALLTALGALAVLLAIVIVVTARRGKQPPAIEEPTQQLPSTEVRLDKAPQKQPALAIGLGRTRQGFIARLGNLVGRKQIDEQLLEGLEEVLFTADIGARTAERLLRRVKERLAKKELIRGSAVLQALKDEAKAILVATSAAAPLELAKVGERGKPFVVLTIGVNGAGKTTTIGKLGAKWTALGKKVVFAAGDTFRAAAAEQLAVWAGRAGADLVRGKEGTDPSSVIFDGVKRGIADGHDVVIADTAGRLQTKTNLMQELQKVRRVIQKALPDAPHETLLVLDATNGQNAISQATLFKEAVQVTGIVLTKLDGTAKGGVILGICEELGVPVRFVGIGEQIEDLRPFDADEFVSALFDDAIAEATQAEAVLERSKAVS
jgi:fused signal recognition particle receptor